MELLIAVIFGALVGTATLGTKTQEDCKTNFDYKPQACKPAKILEDIGNLGK